MTTGARAPSVPEHQLAIIRPARAALVADAAESFDVWGDDALETASGAGGGAR